MNAYIAFAKIDRKKVKLSETPLLPLALILMNEQSDVSAVTHNQYLSVPHSVKCKFYMLFSRTLQTWIWFSILSSTYSTALKDRVKGHF
jgi:hypothetical protein